MEGVLRAIRAWPVLKIRRLLSLMATTFSLLATTLIQPLKLPRSVIAVLRPCRPHKELKMITTSSDSGAHSSVNDRCGGIQGGI